LRPVAPRKLAQLVADLAPDVIVNAAAYTAVDRAESEEALATTVNGTAPGELARAAKAAGALLVHYSTDYVFDGTNASPYDEDDPVAPLNAYGRSKLAGETVIRASGCDHLILRTTWVFAARGGNFVRTMLRLGAERETLRVVADQVGAPTWARNIADATALIVAQAQAERHRAEFASGVFTSRPARDERHGFAEAIFAPRAHDCRTEARKSGPSSRFRRPITRPRARPANSCLLPGRLQARFGVGCSAGRRARPLPRRDLRAMSWGADPAKACAHDRTRDDEHGPMSGFEHFARDAIEVEREIRSGHPARAGLSDRAALRRLAREALDGGAEHTRALLRDPDPQLKARGELFAFAVLMLRTMQESAETGLHTHGGPAWKAFGSALIEEADAGRDQRSGDSSA